MKSSSYGLIPSFRPQTIKRSSSSVHRLLASTHSKTHQSHRSLQLEATIGALSSNFKLVDLLQQLPSQPPYNPAKLRKTSLPIRFFRRIATARKPPPSSTRSPSPHTIISLPSAPQPKPIPKTFASPGFSYTDSLLRLHTLQPHRRAVELNVLHRVRQSQKRRVL
jgi:hypothetical protein